MPFLRSRLPRGRSAVRLAIVSAVALLAARAAFAFDPFVVRDIRIEGVQREAFQGEVVEFPRMDRLVCSKAALDDVLAHGALPTDIEPVELGAASLKGIQDPVALYWLKTG
mgnify:CR=1 FL=1